MMLLLPVLGPAHFIWQVSASSSSNYFFISKNFFFNTLFNSLLSFEHSSSLHSASFMFLIKMKSCRASQPDFHFSPRFFVVYFCSRKSMCFFEPIRKLYPVTCPSLRLLVGWQTWSKPAYLYPVIWTLKLCTERSNFRIRSEPDLQHAKRTAPRDVVVRLATGELRASARRGPKRLGRDK